MVRNIIGTCRQLVGCPLNRPYTGFDGNSRGPQPGTVALRDLILFLNEGRLTHLGTYAKRDARGKPGQPSVHQTGRAVDIGYQYRKDITAIIDWLVTNADLLGVEMVADYWPQPWGRAWRCDRAAWKIYDRRTIHGAPGGKWIHIEISPTTAHDAATMTAALEKALGQ
jgi:hypothetical protein